MAFIHATSSTVAWLCTSHSPEPMSTMLHPMIARLARRSLYMWRMKNSITSAIAPAMMKVMSVRALLSHRWSMVWVSSYISSNMSSAPAMIMATKVR